MTLQRSRSFRYVTVFLLAVAMAGVSESRAQEAPRAAKKARVLVTQIFALKYMEADQHLQATLTGLLTGRGKIAVDKRTNSVIVQSDAQQLAMVRDLLSALDVDATRQDPRQDPGPALRDRQVRIIWLMSGLDEGSMIPNDMKEITDQLSRYGVTGLKLVAQTIVRGRDLFTTSAYPDLDGKPILLNIHGEFVETKSAESVQMKISLSANVASTTDPARGGARTSSRTSSRGGSRGEALAQVETTILTPFGHPVVLCMNPVNKKTSVFIVEVQTTR